MYISQEIATFQIVLSLMAVMLGNGRCHSGERAKVCHANNGEKVIEEKLKMIAEIKDQVKMAPKEKIEQESTKRTPLDNAINTLNRRRNASQVTT